VSVLVLEQFANLLQLLTSSEARKICDRRRELIFNIQNKLLLTASLFFHLVLKLTEVVQWIFLVTRLA